MFPWKFQKKYANKNFEKFIQCMVRQDIFFFQHHFRTLPIVSSYIEKEHFNCGSLYQAKEIKHGILFNVDTIMS